MVKKQVLFLAVTLVLLLLLGPSCLSSVTIPIQYEISGQVRCWRTGEAVTQGTVRVLGTNEVESIDQQGRYKITALPGSTLEFTAEGFTKRTYVLPESLSSDTLLDIDLYQTGEELVFYVDFLGDTVGKPPAAFVLEDPSKMSESVWLVDELDGRRVLHGHRGAMAYIKSKELLGTASPIIVLGFHYWQVSVTEQVQGYSPGFILEKWPPAFFFHLGTKAVSFYDGTRITTLPQDRWVRVRFVIDCSSQTCDLYLDDLTTPVVTNVPFREPIENFEKAYLRIGKEQTSGEDYWHTLQIVAVTDY